ncbi:MAG: hypothetical protein Q8L29_04100 [archaeon]|nr:hypothetical protein [archaeon]
MKKGLFIFIAIFLIPLCFAEGTQSASVLIGQPASIYNLGDRMSVNISLNPQVLTNDFLIVKLICNGETSEIYRTSHEVNGGEQKIVPINLRLDYIIVGKLQGTCILKAKYGSEERESQNFGLSNSVVVEANASNTIFGPGESVIVSGKAIKTNGAYLNGFVEITSSELIISITKIVGDGNLDIPVILPAKAPAGKYELNVRAYEKDLNGATINEGSTGIEIIIRQVPTKIDIAFDILTVNPNGEISYTSLLLDQNGTIMNEDVDVTIYTPSGEIFAENMIKSKEVQVIEIGKNYAPGGWKVKAKKDSIENDKTFYVTELQEASFDLTEDTLVVTNTGNVIFNKTIEVVIGGVSKSKELNLKVGESKKFFLAAPDGNYDILVKDDSGDKVVGSSFLTGNAIAVKDGYLDTAWSTSFLVWFFLIMLFGAFAFVNYKKISGNQFVGRTPKMARITENSPKIISVMPQEKAVLSNSGKEVCSLVSVKIKNLEEIKNSEGPAAETIERVMRKAKESKAKIQSNDSFKSVIFSPALTKQQDNILSAANFAKEAEQIFNEHNRKYGQKIQFGIGIHQGEMIIEPKMGGMEYTSVGNVSLVSRKLADNAESNVLMSGEAHRKTLGRVKVEKIAEKGWKLNSVTNRGNHSGFIKGFLNRQ